MSPFRRLAAELGTSDRSLRRAANRGLFEVERSGPRRAEIPLDERAYLRKHWDLLSRVVSSLRTERSVRLAVLFGSTARGDDSVESDIDIAVALAEDDLRTLIALELRLAQSVDRAVQLVSFANVVDDPMLPSEVLRDGRVLIDRDGLWRGPWRAQVKSEAEVDEWLDEFTREALEKGRRYLAGVG